ncbi:hypothetical protein ACE6H2_018403 [Prunus campanulata]
MVKSLNLFLSLLMDKVPWNESLHLGDITSLLHEREGKLQLWSSKLPENLVGLMLLLESGIKFLVP